MNIIEETFWNVYCLMCVAVSLFIGIIDLPLAVIMVVCLKVFGAESKITLVLSTPHILMMLMSYMVLSMGVGGKRNLYTILWRELRHDKEYMTIIDILDDTINDDEE